MTKTALVTGGPDRVNEVAVALRSAGFDVLEALDATHARAVLTVPGVPVLDAYVQLPVEVEAAATTVTSQMAALLEQGIVGRFHAAEVVLDHLAPGAHVVLVPGNLPQSVAVPDDHHARRALLEVLAHALRADRAPDDLSVTVASAQHSPGALALLAGGTEVPHPPAPDYAAMWPELSYDEWRLAVLGLDTLEG